MVCGKGLGGEDQMVLREEKGRWGKRSFQARMGMGGAEDLCKLLEVCFSLLLDFGFVWDMGLWINGRLFFLYDRALFN